VVYQFATLFTVIANPYTANVVEWVHAWMLVSGALVVGWTIGRAGHAKLGLSLLLVGIMVLAVITLVHATLQYARGDFGPVYLIWPYGMHKNFVGTVLCFGGIIAYARPSWMGWSRTWALSVFWLISLGMIVTQSRQAILALGVALVIVALRQGEFQQRSRSIVFVLVPALVFVGTLVRDQVQEGSQFNSVFQRVTWFAETIKYWSESPWVGHGLRYWYKPLGLDFQPPNAELEVLASAGVVGLAAFLVFLVAACVVLWRLDPTFGTLAVSIVLARIVQGQLDLFWTAVQVSIPFVVAGVCLGVEALHRERQHVLAVQGKADVVGALA